MSKHVQIVIYRNGILINSNQCCLLSKDESSLLFSTYPNSKIGNRRKYRISKYLENGGDESSSQEIYIAILRFIGFSIIFLLVSRILRRQPSIILYLNNEINQCPWRDQMSKIQVDKPIRCTTLIILSK